MDKAKMGWAALLGALSAWWGENWMLILMVAVWIVFDYITGLLAAAKEHNVNSQKATDGIYKKVGLLLLMALGFGLDAAISYFIAAGLSFDLPVGLPFGLIVCAWIMIGESISVIENLVRLGVSIPKWLTSFLKIAQDKLGAESEVSGNENLD